MYGAQPRTGLGSIDWGEILQTSIQTTGQIFSGQMNNPGGVYYPTGISTYPYTGSYSSGMSLTTVALLGLAAFFLVKAMGRR